MKYFLFTLILFTINYTAALADTLNTPTDTLNNVLNIEQAAAKDFSYSQQYHQSIKNLNTELNKLRAITTVNPDIINVINVKSVSDSNEYAIQKEILSEDNAITKLRNYLNNSADEKKIQKIKRVLNARSVKTDDIVSLYISGEGIINLYYYHKK